MFGASFSRVKLRALHSSDELQVKTTCYTKTHINHIYILEKTNEEMHRKNRKKIIIIKNPNVAFNISNSHVKTVNNQQTDFRTADEKRNTEEYSRTRTAYPQRWEGAWGGDSKSLCVFVMQLHHTYCSSLV